MKKSLIMVLGAIVVAGGFYFIKSNLTHKEISSNTKLESTDINSREHYNKNNRFDKGYDGNYDKAAVEEATKDHSMVTLNKEFKVYGKDNIEGATDCIYKRDIDGDTIVIELLNTKNTDKNTDKNNKGNITVRFFGIDTAEDVNPKIHCIEPYSIQAKDYVENKLEEGEKIKVLFNNDKGKYGRDVGTIYYNEGGEWYDLNAEEVANGLARIAYLNKNNTNIDTKALYAAEDSAKSQKLNIWSIDGYVTPRGYNLAIFK